jgi:hypothetical protein
MSPRNVRTAAVALACWSGLAFLGAPPARAYINAGFRSEGDYRRYLNYEKLVNTSIGRYSAAVERNPRDAVAYYQRARAWENLPPYNGPWPDNQPETKWDGPANALKDYNRALALDTKFGRAYLRRGALLWEIRRGALHYESGKREYGLADLRQAVRLEPKWTLARACLALAYSGGGDKEERKPGRAKLHALRACKATGYADAACLQVLAAVCARENDFGGAVKWQTKAVGLLKCHGWENRARQRLRAYKAKKDPSPALTLGEPEQVARNPRPPR